MPTQERNEPPLSTDTIRAAYATLFGDDRDDVHRFKPSGVRYVDLPNGRILVEQNPDKDSHWARLARAGHQIAWVMQDGDYLARVMDGNVEILHHP